MPNLQAPPYAALFSHSFLYVALFSAAIAGLLWAVQPNIQLSTMAISQIIGFTINLSFVLFGGIAENYMNPYIAPIPIVAIGLAGSLLVAGSLVLDDPWFFFVDEGFSTILFGVFFGVVGFLMFGTRARLLRANIELAR
ncbi:MAG: hypothetical protein GXP16_04110, partial [Gammaproteobacteria bacterium]|nr:hypothetical protein [Gammaproteobacteria bacterium]